MKHSFVEGLITFNGKLADLGQIVKTWDKGFFFICITFANRSQIVFFFVDSICQIYKVSHYSATL